MTLSAQALEHRLVGVEKALSDECANSLRLAQQNARLRDLLSLARGAIYVDLREEIDSALSEAGGAAVAREGAARYEPAVRSPASENCEADGPLDKGREMRENTQALERSQQGPSR